MDGQRWSAAAVSAGPATAARTSEARSRAIGSALTVAVLISGFLAAVALGRLVPHLADAAPQPVAAAAAAAPSTPPVPGVPLGGFAGDGPGSKTFTANGHQVAVGVVCSGGGTLALQIGAETPTVFTCDAGTQAFGIATSTTGLDTFTVTVTPDGPATWSIAAGAQRF